jgi:FixJ family two-component response regulator
MADGVIHLIDDEQDIVTVAAAALQSNGYAVHSFSDPAKALEDMELKCREKVGMVITDIRMPGHSGFDIARRTRMIKHDVPVILMTAFEINPAEFL